MNKRQILIVIGLAAAFAGGFLVGRPSAAGDSDGPLEIRENDGKFSYVNPLLECNVGQEYLTQGDIRPSKDALTNMISSLKASGDITEGAVYFRDLNNGPWISIDANTKFLPASLMKVPLMMYFYRQSESDPSVLRKEVGPKAIPNDVHFNQHFPSPKTIDQSKVHTVDQLIDSMITYSDNYATVALDSIVGTSTGIANMMSDLRVDTDPSDGGVSVRDYSTFFRVLFNASYLDQEDSERALKLLAGTSFDKGLVKYLPKDLIVSHKFGEREPDSNGISQVHDCGIIYYPLHPYLACVMTRGYDQDRMIEAIAKMSKFIYDQVDSQK